MRGAWLHRHRRSRLARDRATCLASGQAGVPGFGRDEVTQLADRDDIQLGGVLGGGGALGYMIAQRVDPTSLPQTVAAFHSLVGLAAVFTGAGDFLAHSATHPETLDGLRTSAISLATVIGQSIVAAPI